MKQTGGEECVRDVSLTSCLSVLILSVQQHIKMHLYCPMYDIKAINYWFKNDSLYFLLTKSYE